MPSEPRSSPSSAPSALPSTASGTARCMIVSAFTSTIELPIPSTPSARTATTATGAPPIESERQPEQRKADREVPRETAAAGEDERDEPSDEPSDADRGVEQPDARRLQVEQLERGDDDEHVERARDERLGRVEADERPQRRLAGDRRDARQAPRRSRAAGPATAARTCGSSRRGARATRAADQRNVAPFAANTTCGLLTASRRPPSAGPRNVPTLSIVLEATFAAVSSAGVRTSDGSSADCAGRKTVPHDRDTATWRRRPAPGRPPLSGGRDGISAHAREVLDDHHATRGKRSTNDAVNGAASAAGTSRINPTSPTAAAPPWS